MEKQSIIKALERARDEIAAALNLVQHGVINPGAPAAAPSLGGDEGGFDDNWPVDPAPAAAPAAEPAKRGRRPKAAAAPAPDSDPFADAMNDASQAGAAPAAQGGDDDGFFSEQPPVDTGPTEKMVNDALVAAVTRLVAAGNGSLKKTDARDKVLGALEKKFGDKNPAKLKTKWAEIIAYFTPKK